MTEVLVKSARFAEPQVRVSRRGDGTLLVDSPIALEALERCIGVYLEKWAALTPDRAFLQQRNAQGQWEQLTYGQALHQVYQLGTWLLKQDVGPDRPVVVLSDNSIDHALIMLACMHIGVPYSAISSAYSLVSKDHAKLKCLISRLEPGVIYAADAEKFGKALDAIRDLHTGILVTGVAHEGTLNFASLLQEADTALVGAAYSRVDGDTVAKILFTSGSTSEPKGVINTQRMLCASQQGKAQLWPFLQETPPVMLDWLPWNHTFGGNHNFNLILVHGGTLYIDGGRPVPGLFDISLANLREVKPTLYLNVPRGFDMLVPALGSDAGLRKAFFSRLQVLFYAAAALPQHLWEALVELSEQELGHALPMVTAWGSTETSPLATDCHFQAQRSGVIGLPIPGVTLKLVPNGDKLEVRVKGPVVTPGYHKQPELNVKAFDDEGYYMIGDAVRFFDVDRPELGLVFDGRVSEDFKLGTGTWVSVGMLRLKVIEKLAPLAQDVVVAGHDRDGICVLIVPNVAACRQLCSAPDDTALAELLRHEAIRNHVHSGLAALRNIGGGSSTFAQRAMLMHEPMSVDAGEITDKAYINQSAVLKNRAALVERLYATTPDDDVIVLQSRTDPT